MYLYIYSIPLLLTCNVKVSEVKMEASPWFPTSLFIRDDTVLAFLTFIQKTNKTAASDSSPCRLRPPMGTRV